MEDFGLQKMQEIQKQLQAKYKDQWSPLTPELGKQQLLWLVGELGEVVDVVKKEGDQKIMEDKGVRTHFVEEMVDVMMYFNDVMLCYDVTVEEFKHVYLEKHYRNMERW